MRYSSAVLLVTALTVGLLLATADPASARRRKKTLPKLECAGECPLVLIMVSQQTKGTRASPWWERKYGCREDPAATEMLLNQDLRAIGYRVIERQTLPGGGAGLCWIESATPGSKELRGYARSLGAEILIHGELLSTDPCPNMMGTSMRNCTAGISLRAIEPPTGKVLATINAVSPGGSTIVEQARVTAIRNAVRKATIGLGERLGAKASGAVTTQPPTGRSAETGPSRKRTRSGRDFETVEAKAEAADRDAAIRIALRAAVQQLAQTLLSKKTHAGLKPWLERQINEDVRGFVEMYSIRSEGPSSAGFEVELSARVNAAALRDALNLKLRERLGNALPVTLVMIRERSDDPTARPWWTNAGCAGSGLDVAENAFMEQMLQGGFEVIDRRVLQNKAAASCPLAGASPSDAEIRAFGPGLGADVVLLGDATTDVQNSAMMGTQMKNAIATLTLRALRLEDGGVLGSVTVQNSGGHINAKAAMQRALGAAAEQAAAQMQTLLLDRWHGAKHP